LLKAAGFNFAIAHCNFQLRGEESLSEQEFCNNLAEKLRVPFHTISFDTLNFAAGEKISTQMAARQLRYEWFEQIRQQSGCSTIALAHHQNDAIETILLNLTRGTGIAGMHGILPKNGTLVRPLLFLRREEISDVVEKAGIAYMEDSSNASVKYARNKLRLEVIPRLKELNPALEQTFEHNMAHFRDLETFLEGHADKIREELFVVQGDEIHIPISGLKKLEPKRLLLFKLFQEYGFNETTIDDLIPALDKHPGKVFETHTFKLVLDRDKLILTKNNQQPHEPRIIGKTNREVDYGGYKLTLLHDDSPLIIRDNPMAVSVDADLLSYPLKLRAWEQGDYFYPFGMKSRKKLSDFFIDQKVPLHEKGEIPILVNGNGEVIWIGGYRPDDRYKVTDNTKKVTIFELLRI
jgi:tRNA(Ile)-lysidine synthase